MFNNLESAQKQWKEIDPCPHFFHLSHTSHSMITLCAYPVDLRVLVSFLFSFVFVQIECNDEIFFHVHMQPMHNTLINFYTV